MHREFYPIFFWSFSWPSCCSSCLLVGLLFVNLDYASGVHEVHKEAQWSRNLEFAAKNYEGMKTSFDDTYNKFV